MTLIPANVYAYSTPVKYIERWWRSDLQEVMWQETQTTDYKLVSDLRDEVGVALRGDTYVVDRDVSFTNRLGILGNVKLILCDGRTLTCKDGIRTATANAGQSVETAPQRR